MAARQLQVGTGGGHPAAPRAAAAPPRPAAPAAAFFMRPVLPLSRRLLDPTHSMKIAPATAAAAVVAAAVVPATPPAEAAASPARPRVTASRVIPEEAMDSLDSAGL